MHKSTILQRYEFAIMPADSLVSLIEANDYHVAAHLPLMRVNIDFENGKFLLDGDWQFLVSSNKHARPGWFSYHKGRVTIDVSLYPPAAMNLSDPYTNGLVIAADGIIKDGCSMNSCSGLIILDNVTHHSKNDCSGWIITFYLYDYQMEECEIKFKLPVYLCNKHEQHN